MIEDWECLELARRGDDHAWRVLFRRHYAPLVRMTACMTGSLDSAHDVAQESFVRLLRVMIRDRSGSFKAYLSTIAYRLALKERKRQQSGRSLDGVDIADSAPDPLQQAIQDETDRHIFRAMQGLPVEQREILSLRCFGGLSYEQIASVAGLPLGTVKSRIFYAIKSCRDKLRSEGVFA